MTVDLKDGEHQDKVLVARRVAFSSYGQISKLNGAPLDNARVIAKCDGCDRTEETQVDQEGKFRLRGLKPDTRYQLSAVSDSIERTLPHHIIVDMRAEDKRDNQFLAIAKSQQQEISGSVDFEGEDPTQVFKEDPRALVEIYDMNNLDTPVQSQQLSLSRYF